MSKDFRSRTVTGLSWSIVSQVGQQGITFVVGIILARLLSPEEFGLLAMVIVLTSFAELFAELGLGSAIIQKKKITEGHLSSVFWLNIGFGLLLTVLFIFGSGLIASFYQEPVLEAITVWLSLNFIIKSAGIVQQTLFVKKVDFKTLSIVQIITALIAGGIAIYMALSGFGVWSLVAKSLLGSLVGTILIWMVSPWRPQFLFDWNRVKELMGFSFSLLGSRVLNFSTTNIDDLLIGKVLGSSALGNYSKAYSLMQLPMLQISRVISRVMFPSFSSIQDDKQKIAAIYLKMTRVIALLTFPLMVGLFVLAHDFVIYVFGPQWQAMIPLVRIFCVLGISKSIITLVGNLYLSQGRADLQMRVNLFTEPLKVAAIVIGFIWGLQGVAIAYTIACGISAWPNFHFAGKLVGLSWGDLIKTLSGIFGASLGMGIAVYFASEFLQNLQMGYLSLLFSVIAGTGIYWLIVSIFNVKGYREFMQFFKTQFSKGIG